MNLTSQVLELDGQFMYIPNCMLIFFSGYSTYTSGMQLIRIDPGTDLGKLEEAHVLNKDVVHNISGVEEAIERLDEVMKRKPKHSPW